MVASPRPGFSRRAETVGFLIPKFSASSLVSVLTTNHVYFILVCRCIWDSLPQDRTLKGQSFWTLDPEPCSLPTSTHLGRTAQKVGNEMWHVTLVIKFVRDRCHRQVGLRPWQAKECLCWCHIPPTERGLFWSLAHVSLFHFHLFINEWLLIFFSPTTYVRLVTLQLSFFSGKINPFLDYI